MHNVELYDKVNCRHLKWLSLSRRRCYVILYLAVLCCFVVCSALLTGDNAVDLSSLCRPPCLFCLMLKRRRYIQQRRETERTYLRPECLRRFHTSMVSLESILRRVVVCCVACGHRTCSGDQSTSCVKDWAKYHKRNRLSHTARGRSTRTGF